MRGCLKLILTLFLISIFIQGVSLASENPWKEMGIIRKGVRLPAKEFSLPTPDGNKLSLSGLRGKVILLNFWATWCVPCRKEMPSMERVYKKLKDRGFNILAVDMMETDVKVKKFINEMGLTFPVVMDRKGKVTNLYRVNAIPTTYIIDKAGRIAGIAFGAREWDSDLAFELIEGLIWE